eukprot:15212597-Heterocapsa_arctica.AAC.1
MADRGPQPGRRGSRPLLPSASASAARAPLVLVEIRTLCSPSRARRVGSRGPSGGFLAPLPGHFR